MLYPSAVEGYEDRPVASALPRLRPRGLETRDFRYHDAATRPAENDMTYLWVALGGALGSVARYGCSGLAVRWLGPQFPWGTLFVNVSGSLAIGVLAALATGGRSLVEGDVRAFLIVGVLGGFTTFSSFSLDTLNLARAGQLGAASANVALSVVVCLVAVWLGFVGAAALSR
jgi:CrcB protein